MQQDGAVTSSSFPNRKSDPAGSIHLSGIAPIIRHDWAADEAAEIYHAPFMDLLLRAQTTHRAAFEPNKVQFSKLLNVKVGGCPEDYGLL